MHTQSASHCCSEPPALVVAPCQALEEPPSARAWLHQSEAGRTATGHIVAPNRQGVLGRQQTTYWKRWRDEQCPGCSSSFGRCARSAVGARFREKYARPNTSIVRLLRLFRLLRLLITAVRGCGCHVGWLCYFFDCRNLVVRARALRSSPPVRRVPVVFASVVRTPG